MRDQLYRRCKHGSFVAHEQITDRGKVSACEGSVPVEPDYEAATKVAIELEQREGIWGDESTAAQVHLIVDAALKGTDK